MEFSANLQKITQMQKENEKKNLCFFFGETKRHLQP